MVQGGAASNDILEYAFLAEVGQIDLDCPLIGTGFGELGANKIGKAAGRATLAFEVLLCISAGEPGGAADPIAGVEIDAMFEPLVLEDLGQDRESRSEMASNGISGQTTVGK